MTAQASSPPVLSTRGFCKDYGPVRVVSDMSLDLYAGSIHALLGENGAGKSTLIKMLSGAVPETEGYVAIDGNVAHARSVREAQQLGIVALPQELTLVPTLGAAENIFLGVQRPGQRVLINRRKLNRDATVYLERLGQHIPLEVPVGELSAVQQTMIALARALAREAKVLILDEPTAALTDTETEQLFAVLRTLRDQGTAILYVSHRLEEVFALADTATVMRGGEHVFTKPITQTNTADVVSAMIGREHGQVFPDRASSEGAEVLSVREVSGHTLRRVTMSVRAGRVLGIAGLAGSGRSELVKLIAGVERPQHGTIHLASASASASAAASESMLDEAECIDVTKYIDVTRYSVAQSMQAGIALVPEERRSQGLVTTASIQANISLANLAAQSTFGVMRAGRERKAAVNKISELQIKTTSPQQPVDQLSGGNQQKVVLAKYLERTPRVLLLDEPTRGIDIGTKAEIYQLIRSLAETGVAVVVVSSEIPELVGLADEIAVLHEGHLNGIVDAATATEDSILHLCYRKPE